MQAQLNALLTLGVEQRVPAGHTLMREGEPGSHVVIIRHGVAKVTAAMPGGRTALLSIRVAGDLLGEMSALSGSPRCATVTMGGPGIVRLVPHREFAQFLRSRTDAMLALAALTCHRLRCSNRQLIDITAYPVKTRLARVLAELADEHGCPSASNRVEISVRLTQPELAMLCGAAEVSVHKALSVLRHAEVVTTRYGRITVWDLASLRAQAEPAG